MPFKRGHRINIGRKHSEETRKKDSLAKSGKKNPMWKDKPSYKTLHAWIRRHLPKPDLCENCHFIAPYDVACITGIYNRDFENWRWWCRKCHMNIDGRIDLLRTINIGRKH